MNIIDQILLPASLWLIMFSMGLSLTLDDFRRLFTNKRALMIGIVSMLIVPPLVGTLMAVAFAPSAQLAVGFILLATCPGGMLSNLMTDLSKGDLALSLALSVAVSAIYIFLVPIYAYVAIQYFMGVSTTIDVPLGAFAWKIFSITLIPVSLGLIVRRYFDNIAIRFKAYVKLFALTVLVTCFIIIMIDQLPVLREYAGRLLWMTVLSNLIVLCAAYFLTKASKLNAGETSAICIEHLIRQEGTAIFIAVSIVGSREMSLPMIMNTPVGLLLCTVLVIALRKFSRESTSR